LRKPIPEGLRSLIARRNAGEFELWFLKFRGVYEDTKSTNRNHSKLSKRDEQLRSTEAAENVGDLGHLIGSRGYSCHVSYTELILWLCGYKDGQIGRWNSRVGCNCRDKIKCTTVESDKKRVFCNSHGVEGNYRSFIYRESRGVSILFRSIPCVYPKVHVDRHFPLALQIDSQMNEVKFLI
jgi:hypothetical protein